MIVTLRGKLEWRQQAALAAPPPGAPVAADNKVEEPLEGEAHVSGQAGLADEGATLSSPSLGTWTWTGLWSFGSFPEDATASTSAAAAVPAPPSTSSKQPHPLPFAYEWVRAEAPSAVSVPSLGPTITVPTGEDDEDDDEDENDDEETENLPDDEANDGDKVPGRQAPPTTGSNPPTAENAEEASKASANSTTDGAAQAAADQGAPGSTTDSNVDQGQPPEPQPARRRRRRIRKGLASFADPERPGDPVFVEAAVRHAATVAMALPPSGHWKGHFDTIANQRTRATIPIPEDCYMCLNAAPPPLAQAGFVASKDASDRSPLLPAPPLVPGRIHVRGRGENRYGTFELLGSLDLDTMVLECQRRYLVAPASSAASNAAASSSRSRLRKTRDSHLMDNPTLDDGAGGRPYFTRKRPMSWKKRAAILEEEEALQAEIARAKRRSVSGGSTTTAWAGGGAAAKRPRSDSGGSAAGGSGTGGASATRAAAAHGSLPRLTVTIPGSGPLPHHPGAVLPPGAAVLAVPSASLGDPPVAGGDPFAALHRLGKQQLPSVGAAGLVAAGASAVGGGKKRPAGGHPRASAGTPQGSHIAASAALAATTASHVKLPPVGDPHKACWRAAHFLFYHRSESEHGSSNHAIPSCVIPPTPLVGESLPSGPTNSGGGGSTPKGHAHGSKGAPKYVVYEGDMLHSHRDGQGVCLYSNGLLYEGSWKRDKEHGDGVLMTADRKIVVYRGEWERGRMQGRGTYYYGERRNHHHRRAREGIPRYEGEFRENLRHGTGTYFLKDGSVYVGSWLNNVMSGHGVFTWPDGSVYDGDWKDGKRHGQGVLRASDGFTYDGNWSQNSMEGRGTANYPNGQQYIGLFTAGRREGRGTMLFTNGATYEGRFRDDAVDGQGTLRLSRSLVVPRSQQEGGDGDFDASATATATENGDEAVVDIGKEDFMIPVSFQSDMGNIHRRAGFTIGGD